MSLFKITEKFVLNKLKNISQGNLKLINYDGKVFHFGDLESKLSSDIKINNPNFYLNVVMGGSSALGCLLYTSPSPRDVSRSRMPSSA